MKVGDSESGASAAAAKVSVRRIVGVSRIAELLGLPEDTIENWVTSGELPAERISEFHVKIRKESLVNFLLDNGFTLSSEFLSSPPVRIMVYTPNRDRTTLLRSHAEGLAGWSFTIDSASEPNACRIKCKINRPHVAVLFLTRENREEIVSLLEVLAEYPEYSTVKTLIVGIDESAPNREIASHIRADDILGKTASAIDVLERIIYLIQKDGSESVAESMEKKRRNIAK